MGSSEADSDDENTGPKSRMEGDESSGDEEDAESGGDESEEYNSGSGSEEEVIGPEEMVLQMPSVVQREECEKRGLSHLMDLEIELRTAQANDHLQHIRDELGHKCYLLKEKYKHGRTGQAAITRSWKQLRQSGGSLEKHVKKYNTAFKALKRLGATGSLKAVKNKHLTLPPDVMDPKRFGQSQDKLPWIWRTRTCPGENPSQRTEESECVLVLYGLCLIDFLVERVTWLREKARLDRSHEAITTVKDHMGNTIRFFKTMKSQWKERAERSPISQGHRCYAYKQVYIWGSLAKRAEEKFGQNAK